MDASTFAIPSEIGPVNIPAPEPTPSAQYSATGRDPMPVSTPAPAPAAVDWRGIPVAGVNAPAPAPEPAPAPAPKPAPVVEKYKAVPGDTLSQIAKDNGTTVAQILKDNPVLADRAASGSNVLFNGTTVKITKPGTSTNPYGPTVTGEGAGLGTGSVPISTVKDVIPSAGSYTPDLTRTEESIFGVGGGSTGTAPTGSPESMGLSDRAVEERRAAEEAARIAEASAFDGKWTGDQGALEVGQGEDPQVVDTTPSPAPTYQPAPTPAPVAPTPPPVVTPSSYKIKVATPDIVEFGDDTVPVELIEDLLFEDIGGQEILTISRSDIMFNTKSKYQPIKNLDQLQEANNSLNILPIQQTSDKFFNGYPIKLENKIPKTLTGTNTSNVYIDKVSGDLIVEAANLEEKEQVEINMAISGTIYGVNI
jgi:hypothetical protein